jgi:hypothetical protein
MLDHTGIFVPSSQHAEVVKWYEAALAPLGYKKFITEGPNEEVTGLSDNGKHADWWLISTTENIPDKPKMHHAFVANSEYFLVIVIKEGDLTHFNFRRSRSS